MCCECVYGIYMSVCVYVVFVVCMYVCLCVHAGSGHVMCDLQGECGAGPVWSLLV